MENTTESHKCSLYAHMFSGMWAQRIALPTRSIGPAVTAASLPPFANDDSNGPAGPFVAARAGRPINYITNPVAVSRSTACAWEQGRTDLRLDQARLVERSLDVVDSLEPEVFELAQRFADEWDQTSFDPDFPTSPLEHFEPMVREIFARPRSPIGS